MVVMDVVGKDYKHICDSAPAARIAKEIFGKVESLHQAGYVHGNLHSTNLVVRTDGKPAFTLLDFDWAGKIEEVQYLLNVNKGQCLWRPPGAHDGQYILAEHDMSMLHAMFKNMT
jgi:RIO-like serine/threonine protein kinase